MFGFEPEDNNDDLHPEDQLKTAFDLPVGDQFTGDIAISPEQAAFDAIDDHFGTPNLDEWWEKE